MNAAPPQTGGNPDGMRQAWREHGVFIGTALLCVIAFSWMLTYGAGEILAADSFGNFYDYQAQAWLHGRWDVPEPALGGEAFVVNGKVYGYFGPTPAVMRLPFVAAGIGFGSLTRSLMLLDYVGCLIASYLILRHAARLMTGRQPRAGIVVLFIASVGLGSTLFFLASRAYVYHEAILCGAAFTLWSVWCSLRYIGNPRSRAWIPAVLCGILAIHARPPIGLYALTVVGAAGVLHALQQRRATPLVVAAAAAVGVMSFGAVSYLKFGTVEGCPLRYNVQYTPERLAPLEGRNFHVSNLRFNAACYFLRPAVSLRPNFPYVYVEYLNRLKDYPESKMAYRDPTLALPYAMPALVLFALVGGVTAGFSRGQSARTTVGLLWLSAVPLAFAMLTAVAVTQRYTGDFCGWLIPAAAFGATALALLPPPTRTLVGVTAILMALVAIAVESAITLQYQRAVVWGVPPSVQAQYRGWQQRIDGWFSGHSAR